MQTSTIHGRQGPPLSRPTPLPAVRREGQLLGVALIGAAAVAVAAFVLPRMPSGPSWAEAGEISVLIATIAAAGVVLSLATQRRAWDGTRVVAVGTSIAAAYQALGWIDRSLSNPGYGQLFAGTMGLLLLTFLAAFGVDFFEHIRHERAELLSDILLVSTLTGAAVYVFGREVSPGLPSLWAFTATAMIAACAILVVVGWGVLTLWCPTPIHLALFTCATAMGASAILLDNARHFGWPADSLVGAEVTSGIALLATAVVLVIEPRLNAGPPRPPRTVRWIRPGLITISLCGASALMVALISPQVRLRASEATVLAIVVFGTVGLRTLLNQVSMTRSSRQLEGALAERERAIGSMRTAAQVVTASEARHRLLLDAAVDGIVELDSNGTIVRTNGAFCGMVHMQPREVVGRRWEQMAGMSAGGDSLAALPETGEAVMQSEAGATYLEARSSRVPTVPPGTLLMIRDVTASKTAEQTIRTLFQFLQDRDEDRTRLLQRTNAAIEAERNRIARDLHDGPIQGVSAASLSLEAVKLMMESGDTGRALDTLRQICDELGEEAVNLRRIMSDLRPPVLEQRGLVPAVRELCDRWQRELNTPVAVLTDAATAVPSDVETLGYRVVQEALSNVKKHAAATEVIVRIEVSAGTLRVQVRDDGAGFDPEDARDFLRRGRVGLASMRERTELVGGTLTVKSAPGKGTTVTATLPFEILSIPAPADAR